ncbi:hypothetical protein L1987_80947 [Smallanthus sonchifolius]|uniref:Uncharacterized protein n=1 Tax=Smallanthus sonchifolius TaxID=185202 RepID=A0ACB8YPA4_9ASTR|nr:hypothetical protein L1987_80947 [Smallanthus sonchifolius]
MSCSTSVAVSYGGGDAYRPPFTALQWQELEHQALIYKYLIAGVPVPFDLVLPIRRSFEALSARFLHHPTLGYCSYYGKKYDPEPGRCKRTDGKKWRCSKDAHHDSKYCERHMHRGRNRSRKPVESQSLSTATSQINAMNSTNSGKGSCQNVGGARSSSQSLYSVVDSGGFDFGSNVSKVQVDAGPYVVGNKDIRYSQGLPANVDGQNYPSGGNVRDLSLDSNVDSSWGLLPSQISTTSLLKPQNDSYLQTNSLQLNMSNTFGPMLDATSLSKQRQQHSMHPFFNEWPKAKEPWSNLDATTQLSISMEPDFNARNACSPNDA